MRCLCLLALNSLSILHFQFNFDPGSFIFVQNIRRIHLTLLFGSFCLVGCRILMNLRSLRLKLRLSGWEFVKRKTLFKCSIHRRGVGLEDLVLRPSNWSTISLRVPAFWSGVTLELDRIWSPGVGLGFIVFLVEVILKAYKTFCSF